MSKCNVKLGNDRAISGSLLRLRGHQTCSRCNKPLRNAGGPKGLWVLPPDQTRLWSLFQVSWPPKHPKRLYELMIKRPNMEINPGFHNWGKISKITGSFRVESFFQSWPLSQWGYKIYKIDLSLYKPQTYILIDLREKLLPQLTSALRQVTDYDLCCTFILDKCSEGRRKKESWCVFGFKMQFFEKHS